MNSFQDPNAGVRLSGATEAIATFAVAAENLRLCVQTLCASEGAFLQYVPDGGLSLSPPTTHSCFRSTVTVTTGQANVRMADLSPLMMD